MLLKALSSCLNILPKNPTSITPNYQLINNQSGFAPILLVMLLLAGITAGVYLTQTGTSFLPKAQEINDTDCYLSNTINFQGEPVSKISYGDTGKGYVCSKNEAFIYGCLEKGLEIFRLPYYDPICKGLEKGRVETERCENNTALHADGSITDCGGNGLVCVTGIGGRGDSGKIKYAQSNSSQVLGLATSSGPNYAYCSGTYCTNNNRYTSDGNKYIESCKYNQQCLSVTYTGTSPRNNPFIWSTDVTLCKDKKSPSGNIIECGFNDVDHDKATFSHCDFIHNGESRSEDLTFCRAQSRRDYERFKLWCTKTQSQPAQDAATQPAAPAAQTTQPGVVGDCPAGRQLSCSSGEVCKLDHVGTRWCTDPNKKEGDSCGTNCIIIGGLKKAPYPDNTPENGCNSGDKAVCTDANNEECAVFKKNITVSGTAKDVWYSACRKKTGSAPAAGGAAAAAPRSGTGAPAAPAANPASQRQPAAGTQSNPKPATPAECGLDQDGISIPCFKVGVFSSNDELSATEAQAKIAVERYNQSASLIKDVKSKVNSEIVNAAIAAAEKKNAEAKAYAQACVQ